MAKCVNCDCTDDHACPDGCHWLVHIDPDKGICSRCPRAFKIYVLGLTSSARAIASVAERITGLVVASTFPAAAGITGLARSRKTPRPRKREVRTPPRRTTARARA
jgi:hypothetical protein